MELKFLDETRISSVKTVEEGKPLEEFTVVSPTPGNANKGARPILIYDPSDATLDHEFMVPCETPYVVQAETLAKVGGWGIAKTLREAICKRQGMAVFENHENTTPSFVDADCMKVEPILTRHEMDIMLRKNIDFSNHFIKHSMAQFGAIVTEEGFRMEMVFVLRARYNKGIEWKKTKRPHCDQAAQRKGDRMLLELGEMLDITGFPLHEEEKLDGIHQEFLKPEWLTWNQFHSRIHRLQKMRTIQEKEEMALLIETLQRECKV